MSKVIATEETPNPDALKFVLDGVLLKTGVKQFDTPDAAYSDPLAASLFSLGGIESVFYMDAFVTVSKFPNRDWDNLKPRVIQAIESNAENVQAAGSTPNGKNISTADDGELLEKINEVLETNVIPALAGDGGGL